MSEEKPADPLAHVRVGDRPPHGEIRLDEPICEIEHDDYVCTRKPGHPGQHVATGLSTVVAVWPAAVSPTPDQAGGA